MTHLEIKINNTRTIAVSVASSWDELTRDQVLYIAARWLTWKFLLMNEESMLKARAVLLINLIHGKTKKELKEICDILSNYDFETNGLDLLSITDFIFNKNGLTVNKLPSIKIGWFKTLYGPADRLDNLTIHEFSFAINYFNNYSTTKDEKFLDYLICILYRSEKSGGSERGDIREPFNMNTADRFIKQISRLDTSYKQSVYLFFQGCLETWLNAFPLVFKRGDEEQKAPGPPKTFIDVILNISGGKFGTFNETKNESAYLVLKELNREMAQPKPKPKK